MVCRRRDGTYIPIRSSTVFCTAKNRIVIKRKKAPRYGCQKKKFDIIFRRRKNRTKTPELVSAPRSVRRTDHVTWLANAETYTTEYGSTYCWRGTSSAAVQSSAAMLDTVRLLVVIVVVVAVVFVAAPPRVSPRYQHYNTSASAWDAQSRSRTTTFYASDSPSLRSEKTSWLDSTWSPPPAARSQGIQSRRVVRKVRLYQPTFRAGNFVLR